MNWDYFLSDGSFKAKRLPKSTKGVRIKDNTDLFDLRDYLRDAEGFRESIKAYQFCFNEPFCYDVEVDTFYDHFQKNPKNFLGDASKLKGKYEIIDQFIYWEEDHNDGEWIFLNVDITRQLEKLGVVETKEDINEDDWVEYLKYKYRVQDIKDIAKKYSIVLTGNKDRMARGLLEYIKGGHIAHEAPIPIKPGNGFNDWFLNLQKKFVDEVELALSSFEYPKVYVEAVWDMVESDNSQYGLISELAREKMNKMQVLANTRKNASRKTRKQRVTQPAVKEDNKFENDNNLSAFEVIAGLIFSFFLIWMFAKYLA